MNLVKDRPANQPLAIAGVSSLALEMVGLSEVTALKLCAERRQISPSHLIQELFQYPVGLMLPPSHNVSPDLLGSNTKGEPTVLFVGQFWDAAKAGYPDFFNQVVGLCASRGFVLAGTSANKTTDEAFSVHQQDALVAELSGCVDFVVLREKLPPAKAESIPSATLWDLTGQRPTLHRSGSVAPGVFEQYWDEQHAGLRNDAYKRPHFGVPGRIRSTMQIVRRLLMMSD